MINIDSFDDNTLDFSNVVVCVLLTSQTFHNLTNVRSNYLYFLADTHEIYKGSICFTNSVIKCNALPPDPSRGKLYYVAGSKQMMYYDGDYEEWVSLSTPIVDTLTDEEIDYSKVTATGRAVKEYIDKKIDELYKSLGKQPGYNTTPIFETKKLAEIYAATSPLAKAGQCITAPSEDGTEMVMYVIQQDGTIKEYPSMAQVKKLLEWKPN